LAVSTPEEAGEAPGSHGISRQQITALLENVKPVDK
jgi:hypothetical protein